MFFDDSLKGLKKELKAAGTDLSFVKSWQKTYDKVRKQYPALEKQYRAAKNELEAVMLSLKKMEQLLISGADKTALKESEKELKKYKDSFKYEFLISKEDKEFHLIYTTILSLCSEDIKERKDSLILQSEVENLMSITQEALEKQWPDFREMAYYYLGHTDKELAELPHAQKLQLVEKIYMEEFYCPMKQVIEAALGTERADKVMEVELWNS